MPTLSLVAGRVSTDFKRSAQRRRVRLRVPLAITLLGDLTTTTFLTLFIIPIIYSLIEKVSFKKAKVAN